MTEVIGFTIAATLLGAAWRRWFGSEYNSRLMKVGVLFVLSLLIATYATQNALHGLIVALLLIPGFADGVIFHPQKPLVYRYGFVTAIIALVLVYLGHNAYFYAPVGCAVYLGYAIPKYIIDRWFPGACWSCFGEAFCGAIILGPLPMLRWFG